jgi:hypothetical protein
MMSRKVDPELEIEIIIDDSPEARAAYLEMLKIILRDIHEKRERAREHNLTHSA